MSQVNILFGTSFFLASLLISSLNDVLSKYIYISSDLGNSTLIFYRYFFAVLTVFPFLKLDLTTIKKREIKFHLCRGLILVAAIFFWNKGLMSTNIGAVTLISLAEPMIVLFLSPFILNEKIRLTNWFGTLVCLLGAFIATSEDFSFKISHSFGFLSCSVFLFAVLDLLFKKFNSSSSFLETVFFTSLIPVLFFAPLAKIFEPSFKVLCILFCLGMGNNLLIWCMLKAYKYVSVSDLAPFKYFELVLSVSLGYVLFDEIPNLRFLIGGILILTALIITFYYKDRDILQNNK